MNDTHERQWKRTTATIFTLTQARREAEKLRDNLNRVEKRDGQWIVGRPECDSMTSPWKGVVEFWANEPGAVPVMDVY